MSNGPRKLQVSQDVRGVVFEPLQAGELAAQRNVHVVLTRPGEIRGNHLHPRGTEVFAVMGPALVRIRECVELRDFEVPEGEVWRFEVPPGVAHAIRHGGAGPGLIVSFNTRPHDPGDPDTQREVLIEASGGVATA